MSCSHVKSYVNFLTWLLIGIVHSWAANQEPACLLTQLLAMTTAHKFPSQEGHIEEDQHQPITDRLQCGEGAPAEESEVPSVKQGLARDR